MMANRSRGDKFMSLFLVIYCANIFPGTHYLRLASMMMRKYQSLFSCLNRIECEMSFGFGCGFAGMYMCTLSLASTSLPFPDWAFFYRKIVKMQIFVQLLRLHGDAAQLRWLKKSHWIYRMGNLNFKYSFSEYKKWFIGKTWWKFKNGFWALM
jgi:hypothetical protein